MTAFPQQPEHLRPILDAFLLQYRRLFGDHYKPPAPVRQKWAAGARALYETLGALGKTSDGFVDWAFDEYRKRMHNEPPESPRSLMFLAKVWKPVCKGCGQVPEYCLCEEET